METYRNKSLVTKTGKIKNKVLVVPDGDIINNNYIIQNKKLV